MKPPRTIVSGGTGLVGRYVVERLIAEGHDIVVTGRTPPRDGLFSVPVHFVADHLEPDEDHTQTFSGADCFVHCAFDHLPGKFRGGEGNDPEGFRRRNLDGTLARFRMAKAAGVKRVVFFSSRAVYGAQPRGAELDEKTVPHPNSLYGEVKLACEEGLAALADDHFRGVSLRVTGVYGSGRSDLTHKWAGIIRDHLAGRPVPLRCGTEVHGEDVAWAVLVALSAPMAAPHEVFCVSDIMLDNADIVSVAGEAAGVSHPLPERADPAGHHVMNTARLRALGWRPGGRELFEETVRAFAVEAGEP